MRKTISTKRLTRAVLGANWEPQDDTPRPKTGGECRDGVRPCPWIACRHSTYLDVNPDTGSIKLNWPGLEPHELEHSCALDVAEMGGLRLEQVGAIMNITREAARQYEVRGLMKLRWPLRVAGVVE